MRWLLTLWGELFSNFWIKETEPFDSLRLNSVGNSFGIQGPVSRMRLSLGKSWKHRGKASEGANIGHFLKFALLTFSCFNPLKFNRNRSGNSNFSEIFQDIRGRSQDESESPCPGTKSAPRSCKSTLFHVSKNLRVVIPEISSSAAPLSVLAV